jgi:fructose-bisphosphate aldolase class 1
MQSKASSLLEEEARKLHDHIEAGDAQLLQLQEHLESLQASTSSMVQALGKALHALPQGHCRFDFSTKDLKSTHVALPVQTHPTSVPGCMYNSG